MASLLGGMVLSGIVLLGACGGGTDVGETQPRPNVTTFEQGAFDDLPLHPRSDPIGAPADTGDSEARSYVTVGAEPRGVLAFYEAELPGLGWNAVGPVEDLGTESFRGRWTRDDLLLTVSATRAQGVEGESPASDEIRTQYSLSLEPA